MNKIKMTISGGLFLVLILAFASQAEGQATRTWVSGVGDDANPCSRTAPCKSFAGAISKTAVNGEIDTLDAGSFGMVTITKSITIDGRGAMAGILAAGVSGITINIGTADTAKSVRLRGLSINGGGTGINGINVISANKVSIENCVIDGFTTSGVNVAAGGAFLSNTTIRNNKVGINVTAGQVGLDDVSILFNGTGLVGGASIVSFNDVVLFGNMNGDPPPPRNE